MMGRRNGRIHYFKTYLVCFLTGQPRERASNHRHFELSSLESGTYPVPGLLVCDLKDDVITWFRVQCWNQWARVYFSKTNRIARAWRVQFVVFEAHLVQNCTRNHVLHITEGVHTIISVKLFCFNFRDALITITSLVGDDKLDMIFQNCIIMRSQRGQISGSFALFGINWHAAQPNRMQKLLCAYWLGYFDWQNPGPWAACVFVSLAGIWPAPVQSARSRNFANWRTDPSNPFKSCFWTVQLLKYEIMIPPKY